MATINYFHPQRFAEVLASEPGRIVLFGAGDLGKLAHYALQSRHIHVSCFCDNSTQKQGAVWRGIPIVSTHELQRFWSGAHVFICGNYISSICSQLELLNFTKFYSCTPLFEDTDFSKVDFMQPLDIERKIALHQLEHLKIGGTNTGRLNLKYIDVVITEACSMKCVDCSNLMQYYTKPRHSDLDRLLRALDRIIACVDSIYELRVLGGEPFVNKDFHKIIRKLVTYPQVSKIIVYTNATIVPLEENLSCLCDPKVILDITNYGDHSRNYDKLIQALETNAIAYLTKKPVWTDSGRIQFKERTEGVLDAMFKNCCVNDVLTLLNGRLYRCPFSANGTNLGAIPVNEADVIDLLLEDLGIGVLRTKIQALCGERGHLTACSYCNGRDYTTPKIMPAIQTIKPLPLP